MAKGPVLGAVGRRGDLRVRGLRSVVFDVAGFERHGRRSQHSAAEGGARDECALPQLSARRPCRVTTGVPRPLISRGSLTYRKSAVPRRRQLTVP
jgi:hypothetical protein